MLNKMRFTAKIFIDPIVKIGTETESEESKASKSERITLALPVSWMAYSVHVRIQASHEFTHARRDHRDGGS